LDESPTTRLRPKVVVVGLDSTGTASRCAETKEHQGGTRPSGTLYSWGRWLWFTKNRAHRTITLDQAIDEIGVQGSAAADTTSSEKGARQPSATL